ncbi:MAG: anti-sigma factor [Proteobacteria bacterium]|nr:anti-sigma factor [Pseudomonadota bacterium]
MNDENRPSEAELHAYVDGALNDEDHDRVEAWLAQNPDAAEEVAGWMADSEALRAAFAPYERTAPGDARLIFEARHPAPVSARRPFALAAAAVVIFALGAVGGYALPRIIAPAPNPVVAIDALPSESRNAFLVYASEKRHPVEVYADDETHLASWLGKRLALDNLKVPNLKPQGFKLVGGRLVPVAGEAGAMFMYENDTGERLTVLIGKSRENRETSFRFASLGGVETFYWLDQEIGCAVSGEISSDTLRQVAEAVYRQLPV